MSVTHTHTHTPPWTCAPLPERRLSSCALRFFRISAYIIKLQHWSLLNVLGSVRQERWLQVEGGRRDLPAHWCRFAAPARRQIDSCSTVWDGAFEIHVSLFSHCSQRTRKEQSLRQMLNHKQYCLLKSENFLVQVKNYLWWCRVRSR